MDSVSQLLLGAFDAYYFMLRNNEWNLYVNIGPQTKYSEIINMYAKGSTVNTDTFSDSPGTSNRIHVFSFLAMLNSSSRRLETPLSNPWLCKSCTKYKPVAHVP